MSNGNIQSKLASGRKLTLREIEDLFVLKLQEKYQLTKRDLNRAFSKFDKDGNGFLDTAELGSK